MIPNGNLRLLDMAQIVQSTVPVDLNGGAQNGDWISMKNFHRVAFIVSAAVGTAGSDVTITAQQATDNAGSGAKALTYARLDVKQAVDITGVGQFTKVERTASEDYTDTDNGEEQLVYVVDFGAQDLDIANNFDHVRLNLDAPGATKLGSVVAIAYGPKFGVEPGRSVL